MRNRRGTQLIVALVTLLVSISANAYPVLYRNVGGKTRHVIQCINPDCNYVWLAIKVYNGTTWTGGPRTYIGRACQTIDGVPNSLEYVHTWNAVGRYQVLVTCHTSDDGNPGAFTAIAEVIVSTATFGISATPTTIDFGEMTLPEPENIAEFEQLMEELVEKTLEMEDAVNGGDTEQHRTQIEQLQQEIAAIRQQIQALEFQPQVPATRPDPGTVRLFVTGTVGDAVTLAVSDQFASTKTFGNTLGSLSAASGTIPFTVTYTPSGNYGAATITATRTKDNAQTSVVLTMTGQYEEDARAIEAARHAQVVARINAVLANWTAILIIVGVFLAVLGTWFPWGTAMSLLLAAVFAALTIDVTARVDAALEAEAAQNAANLVHIEALPEHFPVGGQEDNF